MNCINSNISKFQQKLQATTLNNNNNFSYARDTKMFLLHDFVSK